MISQMAIPNALIFISLMSFLWKASLPRKKSVVPQPTKTAPYIALSHDKRTRLGRMFGRKIPKPKKL